MPGLRAMLELSSLLLRPWIHSFEAAWPKATVRGGCWMRAIVEPVTDLSLGFAVWDAAGLSGFFSWLGRKKVQVFESEDESLLMTLYRPWGLSRKWEVVDAEERRIGRLFRDVVLDGMGELLATMSAYGDGLEMALRDPEGAILATWRDIPGQGRYFRFGEAVADNPFLRMAVLAGVLALPPWPGEVVLLAKPAV
jgi:hypothetical protein